MFYQYHISYILISQLIKSDSAFLCSTVCDQLLTIYSFLK